MKENIQELLQTIPWFEGLSDQALVQLSRHARIQRYPAGTILFVQGDIPDFCYVELEGSIELFVTCHDLKESLVEISNALNAYTMAAVLTGAPYIVSGRTITPATILMLEAQALRKSARAHTQLGINLLGLISWQFRTMVRQVVNLKSKSTSERLGCYLLALSDLEKSSRNITLPLDKRRLAAQLGMTPMSLSRAFKTLSIHGIETRGNTISITNPDQLRAYSRPDHLINEAERKLRFLAD
jgi:CRP/FNR family transcriptional regulator, transcriptional activator FtrB